MKVRRQSPRFHKTESTNQITTLTLLIAFVFSITDIPIVVSGMFSFPHDSRILHPDQTAAGVGPDHCDLLVSLILSEIVPMTLLISSSYTIFCFFIMNTQYRDTLKFLLSKSCTCSSKDALAPNSVLLRRANWRDEVAVSEQTTGVLRPLTNML